jgi:hypothetical protein
MVEIEIRKTGKIRDVYALFIDESSVRNKDLIIKIERGTINGTKNFRFEILEDSKLG